MPDLQCPICADDMSLPPISIMQQEQQRHRAVGLPCCGQMICQDCLYKHLKSCFEEGLTGQGRSSLKCPFGCGHELTDKVVRETITRHHFPDEWIWQYIIRPLMRFVFISLFELTTDAAAINDWTHCRNAKRDLERYDQWSLAVALRKEQSTTNCPMPGCDYRWITNPEYRTYKQAHETKRTLMWYAPPKPEPRAIHWAEPEFVNIGTTGNFVEPDSSDGRRMVCAACLCTFCGLCRRPWETNRRKGHKGMTCIKYSRIMPYDEDSAFVASLTDARCCPGCSMRTERTEGCNHMTCPCGYEWCYVCEVRWNGSHYSCVDRQGRNFIVNDGNRDGRCTIM